jgi:hypothetical protein
MNRPVRPLVACGISCGGMHTAAVTSEGDYVLNGVSSPNYVVLSSSFCVRAMQVEYTLGAALIAGSSGSDVSFCRMQASCCVTTPSHLDSEMKIVHETVSACRF